MIYEGEIKWQDQKKMGWIISRLMLIFQPMKNRSNYGRI
ncbi:hypothetical protein NBRC111893_2388 [Lentilactobacillus kosonis]|uniref:Uncharacterized protein n=1 Tax=Lentilactobacillus kosonis TaxID=2810561 RepID=A0A401FPF0_9LACO|nr:hypothetical protein NBRC111893_2388 [Lentilactobacillus kosonis]